jgi:hypothetical protein
MTDDLKISDFELAQGLNPCCDISTWMTLASFWAPAPPTCYLLYKMVIIKMMIL